VVPIAPLNGNAGPSTDAIGNQSTGGHTPTEPALAGALVYASAWAQQHPTHKVCQGTCHGECKVDQDSAQCSGEVGCAGSCHGECFGRCEGSVTPPSSSTACAASADCVYQASAQAEASLGCSVPRLDFSVDFLPGMDASARAAFKARMGELETRGVAIIQGAARLSALVDGQVNGQTVFDPAPLAKLAANVTGFASVDAVVQFDVPPRPR
jgi:hypothetical protein